MSKKVTKEVPDFVEFLKKNKVYRQFKENRKSQFPLSSPPHSDTMESYMKKIDPSEISQAVIRGFRWDDTDPQEEGWHFWSSIDMKWKRECKNAKL